MKHKRKTKFRFFRNQTLHQRLVSIVLLVITISLLASVSVSYVALLSVERNKTESAMADSLKQMTKHMNQAYRSMIQVSQQMLPSGSIGSMVDKLLVTDNQFDVFIMKSQIADSLVTATYPSAETTLLTYYDPVTGKSMFESFPFKPGSIMATTSGLIQVGDIVYRGYHDSLRKYEEGQVISVTRNAPFSKDLELMIYIEAKIDAIGYIEGPSQSEIADELPCILLQADQYGNICYTSNEEINIEGLKLSDIFEYGKNKGQYGVYFGMYEKSSMGYSNILLLQMADYRKELYQWISRIVIVIALSLLMAYIVILIIHRLIYRPLHLFEEEIDRLGEGSFEQVDYSLDVVEFNQLFERFNLMKRQIQKLLTDKELSEQEKHQLETEKLIYQINPHFLMNTLNSVHWLAKIHKQTEISEFVTELNSMLAYNLGKINKHTTFRSEIAMLRNYINIQKLRYDFEADIEVEEGAYQDYPTVRMLLQPLVENSIRYGLGERGEIIVRIFLDTGRQTVVVTIEDHGNGLTKEELDKLQEPFRYDQTGRTENDGIGLRYVRSMLESYYGKNAILTINSELGRGTKITLLLPVEKEGKTV